MPSHDPWDIRAERFDYQPVRSSIRGVVSAWVVVLVVIGLVVLTAIMLWTFGVFASDVRGQGDAEKVKNSAANRIRAQEGFEQLYQDIQSADRTVVISADGLRDAPDDARLRVELRGQRQYCTQLVGQYNAKARQFTSADFRAADLPRVIDTTNPATDCKE